MEFTLHLHSKLEDYEHYDYYPVNQDIRGFCFASKEEKGRIDKNLSFLADVFLGFIQNMKEICCFVLFAHNDKK